MVEYEFYVSCYLGSAIPESAFSGMAARAEAVLRRFGQLYTIADCGAECRKMALCAMAEVLYEAGRHKGIRAASTGTVSVQYQQDSDKALWRELYRSASIYLDIYRGVRK